jgi:hypothetical protein
MSREFDYYEAPSQEVFDDIKASAIKLWKSYDNTYGYVDEKLGRIEDIQNIDDNAWYMVAMFDPVNQIKLLDLVKPETADMIEKALRS